MKKRGKILVVDDNAGIRAALKILLPLHFEAVELINSPASLITTAEQFQPDAVLLDMNFNADINTGGEGLFWLGELKRTFPKLKVVLFTAYADIQLAVEGMKRGAFDFITKPWNNERLIEILSSACDFKEKDEKRHDNTQPNIFWGTCDTMTHIRRTVEKIAPTDATVLITGENGTGKDVLAKEIHRLSARSGKHIISVDAGAIPDTLFESELFGHIKGAFTDAVTDRKGLFEQADGGTIFLDEIGNISLANQAKLLRVIQNRTVTRIGASVSIPIDIRLICATNSDLEKSVEKGQFREDLYYRINTLHINLPPLREREQDILPLAQIFLERYARKYRRTVCNITPEASNKLISHPWNGNIRELQNCIEKAVILCEGETLTIDDISLSHQESSKIQDKGHIETLDEAEERTIRSAMEKYSGNLSLVAKALNISRPTLYNKLKKYGI